MSKEILEVVHESSKDLYEEPPEFWSRLLSGIRPERPELLPSVALQQDQDHGCTH